jgi:hypothetical protein
MNQKKEIIIQAKFDCVIGNRIVEEGDKLTAREDIEGLYWIYLEDEDEPITRLAPHDVDKLAKTKVT